MSADVEAKVQALINAVRVLNEEQPDDELVEVAVDAANDLIIDGPKITKWSDLEEPA